MLSWLHVPLTFAVRWLCRTGLLLVRLFFRVVFPAFNLHGAHAHFCLTCHHLSFVWLQDILLHSPGANMLLHGTSVVKLSYLLKEDIPHDWTEHHDSQATLMAETQGWDIADTETMVFLVAPECPVSLY